MASSGKSVFRSLSATPCSPFAVLHGPPQWPTSPSTISRCVTATTRSSGASRSRCRRARSSPCSGRRAAARPRCCAQSPAWNSRIAASSASARPRFSTPPGGSICRRKRAASASCSSPMRCGRTAPCSRTSPMASSCATRRRPPSSCGSARRWASSASRTSRRDTRTNCPEASSNAWRWRARVYEPAVILLDEPLSNLDAKLREEARAWLRQLIVSLGLSALLVTHDQIEAMAIADRITLLNTGAVEQEGTPTELYQQPATMFAAEFMGNNNRLDGTLVERTDNRAVIEVMGTRLEGVARTGAAVGEKASAVLRLEKVLLGGGAGPNRVLMTLKAQMYIGERWELVFAKDDVSVRAYTSGPLKHEVYHVEFPPSALWIF